MINDMYDDDDWFEREQLHFAVQDGDVDRVKALLAAGRERQIWLLNAHFG